MFFPVFFLVLLHFVASNSNQEDLSISHCYHIGCLTPNPDKQFISNGLQENPLLPYQTFSSPDLTIDLCFRLCRRWIVLMNTNQTNCICLYTLTELYEINEYLGEVSTITNCTTNALQIYSLTETPHILPNGEPTDDSSFEGCYRLDGLKAEHVNTVSSGLSYTQAFTFCRSHCQTNRVSTYVSFFLSLRKFCYCLPITILPSTNLTGIRKPLVHCSFLPYVKYGFDDSFNALSVHVDTVAKISVQRYCSPLFVFDRNLYLCIKILSVTQSNSYQKLIANDLCSPISVKNIEQYNHLVSLLPSSPSRTFIGINRNSTYLFDDLFKSKNNSLLSGDLCLVITRTRSSSDLVSCSMARSSDYIFCAQKPISVIDASEFTSIETTPILNDVICPTDFILFDNLCYYVDTSFVHSIQAGERVCSNVYENSSLVKFDSHQWGNANTTRFLGRALDDILLELFYYELEQKLIIETEPNKHWLRLLVGDKNYENKCVLRYFTRSTGAFTISPRCDQGGHPVCQSQPILINKNISNSFEIIIKPEATTIGIPFPIITNETADEDLDNNGTTDDYSKRRSTPKPQFHVKHRLLTTIISFLVFIALMATIFLISHFLRDPNRNVRRRSNHRRRDSSASTNLNKAPNISTIHYTRLRSASTTSSADIDMINAFEDSIVTDDQTHLVLQSLHSTNRPEKTIAANNP